MNPNTTAEPTPKRPLRAWPAMALFAVLLVVKLGMYLTPETSITLMMLAYFGPMVIGAATLVWWLFFSHAAVRERWSTLGIIGLIAIALLFTAHSTARSAFYLFYPLPIALGCFLLAATVCRRAPSSTRAKAMILGVTVALGVWNFLRFEGTTGDFQVEISPRWRPTAEEQLVAAAKVSVTGSKSPTDQAVEINEPLGSIEWSEFRGPRRDSVVSGITLATDWKVQPPKEVWRRKIGPGWSSFAIAGRRMFTQEQRGDHELVVCYDSDTGNERWQHATPARFWEAIAGAGPRATPTLAQGALFTLGATGALVRFDPLTGTVVWQRNLKDDAQRDLPIWGFSSSPLVVADVVVVHAGGKDDRGLLAYDLITGAPRWQVPSGDHSYSSPQLATIAGREMILMLTNTGLAAHEPATGKLIWEHAWKFEGYRCVQPLVLDESRLLLGTGIGMGTRCIEVRSDGEAWKVDTRWTTLEMKPDYNDYVAHQGHLYGFDHNIFACHDLATGKRLWKKGRYGNGQVLLLSDAQQLLVLSEEGEAVLLRASPEKLDELARHRVLEGKTWNHPVLVGNRLYARNAEEMSCFDLPRANPSLTMLTQP